MTCNRTTALRTTLHRTVTIRTFSCMQVVSVAAFPWQYRECRINCGTIYITLSVSYINDFVSECHIVLVVMQKSHTVDGKT